MQFSRLRYRALARLPAAAHGGGRMEGRTQTAALFDLVD